MKILILHGPNLNLIGKISAKNKETVTLDKINKSMKKFCNGKNLELKIFQTHKVFQAINFLQRNRNYSKKLIFTPMSWSLYEHSLLETIKVCNYNLMQVSFNEGYALSDFNKSIFNSCSTKNFINHPLSVYEDALSYMLKTMK
ncbi:MAG: type II 3-dehydroquinate dehydratase [bacterium TMED144]|nr:MAG: type II 3-dehydroquinate dehydratase [bacterium TMED144]|tara:strand:+ start:237 stop:665 length:429 start_codon:yes stop_codon:yes gene_type:complete